MKIILLILLSILLINDIDCLRCQVCDSTINNDCGEIFVNVNNKYLQTCPGNNNFCRKLVSTVYSSGNRYVKRSCEQVCSSSTNSQPGYQEVYYCCQNDNCNSADHLHKSSKHYIFLSIFLFYYFKYLF